VIRAYRVRVNDRVIERVVAILPEHAHKLKTVAEVEEIQTDRGGLTEDPTDIGS
jgi:hypothetical protein